MKNAFEKELEELSKFGLGEDKLKTISEIAQIEYPSGKCSQAIQDLYYYKFEDVLFAKKKAKKEILEKLNEMYRNRSQENPYTHDKAKKIIEEKL